MASLLRTRLIEDLRIRNHASRTIDIYVRCVALFAKHFRRSPEDLGAVREYQLYLREEKKASWAFFNQTVSALRYLYGKTLQRDSYVNPGALTPHDAEHSAPKNNPVRFNARGVSVHPVEHRRSSGRRSTSIRRYGRAVAAARARSRCARFDSLGQRLARDRSCPWSRPRTVPSPMDLEANKQRRALRLKKRREHAYKIPNEC